MKDRILMVVFVLILGSFLTVTLIAVDSFTAPKIQKNKEIRIKKSVLGALEIPYSPDNVETVFSENIKVVKKDDKTIYISKNGDVSFEMTGSGLWGPIDMVMALKPDLRTIKAVTIIHQEETPGLGGRIAEKSFLDRFKNKKVVPEIKIVPEGKAKADNEVDAITGATMSSKAVEVLINSNIKAYLPLIKEGKE